MITDVKIALADWQEVSLDANRVACWWLGQAGFLVRHRDVCFLIDPYLSNSLAVKYRDSRFKHIRMMPVPIEPGALSGIDWVLCTHRHTDHMDGGTLPGLLAANPVCRIVAPMAAENLLIEVFGIERARTNLVNNGQQLQLCPGVTVHAIASAHEALDHDEAGHALYLGYIFDLDGIRIYHSGDCVPFEGLAETLKPLHIDVALLPVNGRDAFRKKHGVPGNFHLEEAVSLCDEAGIRAMVPHHFGLFDFNTVDPEVLQRKIDGLGGRLQIVMPTMNHAMLIVGGRNEPVVL